MVETLLTRVDQVSRGQVMKISVAGAVAALGLAVTGTANAADYFITVRDRNYLSAFEVSSVKRDGSLASALMVMAKPEPFEIVDLKVAFITSREEFDCEKQLSRSVSPTLHNADGSVIRAMDVQSEWKPLIPRSTGDLMMKAVCDPAGIQSERVETRESARDVVDNYRQLVEGAKAD